MSATEPGPLTRPPRLMPLPHGTVVRDTPRLTAVGARAVVNDWSGPRVVPAALVATSRQW